MSHQDRMSDIVVNHQTIKQVLDWLFVPALFARMKVRKGAAWKPRMLAATALQWATSAETNLSDRFDQARKIVKKVFRWQLPPGQTYPGFMKMLRKWHVKLMSCITSELQVRMKETVPSLWEIAGFVVFAGDGSRVELARTESLEKAYSPTKKKGKKAGRRNRPSNTKKQARQKAVKQHQAVKKQSSEAIKKKADSPQMWLTKLWHVGSGLPWAWRTGPSDSSEREHLEEMLPDLPENSLITADAGFVGYDFWRTILAAKCDFVIRIGANVRLLKELGCARQHEHTVYLWPDAAAKKKQPPLVLRLIVVHNGKHPVYLVTNLTKARLSDQQAAMIYAARWGIEVYFRTLKQTFGRSKLRSRSAENAKLELDWSLIGLWCVCLLGLRELSESGEDPLRLSPAAAIHAFQSTLRDWQVRPECSEENLWSKLRRALRDNYERTTAKTSRNYPRKKKRKRIGAPKITSATKSQVKAANELMQKQHEFRLTA